MVFGIGGGSSKERSESQTQVWGEQARFLTKMWPYAKQLFEQQNANIFDEATRVSDEVSGYLTGAGDILGDIGSGADPATAYMRSRLGQENPYLSGTIDQYGADIARNLAENILPELRSGGVAAGQPGGSRFHLAQGQAADAAQREFSQGAMQMRMADLQQTDAMSGQLAQMNMMAAQGMAGLAEPSYNLGMAPYSAAWMPALNYANVLGSPTIVSESEGSADSWNFSI